MSPSDAKSARNDPCPCGSGLKYKKCCGAKAKPTEITINAHGLYAQALREYMSPEPRLDRVEQLCRIVVANNPNHGDSIHLLGVLAIKAGRHDEAVELIRRALSIDPNSATYHSNLGAALHKLGQLDAAAAEYREALRLTPDHANAVINFGGVLCDLGRAEDAVPMLERAVEMGPHDALAHSNLGLALHKLGREEEAARRFERAVELEPQSIEYLRKAGMTFYQCEQWRKAAKYYLRWTELDPNNVSAHLMLGDAYIKQDLRGEAAAHYAKAFALEPSAQAANNLGTALVSECRHADALAFYRKAVDLEPEFVDGWLNLGKTLKDVDLPDTALKCYDRVLSLEPGNTQARWGRSLCLLAMGVLREGWAEYEWGWTVGARKHDRGFSQPRWKGEDPAGKTILVWMEQGIGDHLLFASMLPDLLRAGAHVIIESEWRTVELFHRSFPGAEVIPATQPPNRRALEPDVDFQIPIGSLGQWLRPTLESFDKQGPYLVADPDRVSYWKDRVNQLGPGLKIGICWRSMLNKGPRSMFYPQLDQWGPILSVPGVHFINLQYDQCEQELQEAVSRFGTPIHNFKDLDLKLDLDGVTALIAALDLMISADTTPVSLAGGVGLPNWVFARRAGGWPFFGQDYLPWFACSRYFFCGVTDPWDAAIEAVANELKHLLELLAAPVQM